MRNVESVNRIRRALCLLLNKAQGTIDTKTLELTKIDKLFQYRQTIFISHARENMRNICGEYIGDGKYATTPFFNRFSEKQHIEIKKIED